MHHFLTSDSETRSSNQKQIYSFEVYQQILSIEHKEVKKVCTLEKQFHKLWKTGMTSIGSNIV